MEAEPDDIPLVTIPPEDHTDAEAEKRSRGVGDGESSALGDRAVGLEGRKPVRTPPPPKPPRPFEPASEKASEAPPSAPDIPTVPAPARSAPKGGPPQSPRFNAAASAEPAARRALPPKPSRQASPTGKVAIPTSDVAAAARNMAPRPRRTGETSGEYPAVSRAASPSDIQAGPVPPVPSPVTVAQPAASLRPGLPDAAYAETVRPAAGADADDAADNAGGAQEHAPSSEEATAAARRPSISPTSDATALAVRQPGPAAAGSEVTPGGTARLQPSITETTGTGRLRIATGDRDRQSVSAITGYQLADYKQRSALMRVMSPFIEDPRPHWELFLYFLVGLGLGLLVAFASG